MACCAHFKCEKSEMIFVQSFSHLLIERLQAWKELLSYVFINQLIMALIRLRVSLTLHCILNLLEGKIRRIKSALQLTTRDFPYFSCPSYPTISTIAQNSTLSVPISYKHDTLWGIFSLKTHCLLITFTCQERKNPKEVHQDRHGAGGESLLQLKNIKNQIS